MKVRQLSGKNRGFTLVELMIVVVIIGVLASLAVYGVSRYLQNAKSAEGRGAVGRMAKDAASAFSREEMSGAVMAFNTSVSASKGICGSVAAPVPANDADVAGKKWQSKPSDWVTADLAGKKAGWSCLKFSMEAPQTFQYSYKATPGNAQGDGASFTAWGRAFFSGTTTPDINLYQNGAVQIDGEERVLTLGPSIVEGTTGAVNAW